VGNINSSGIINSVSFLGGGGGGFVSMKNFFDVIILIKYVKINNDSLKTKILILRNIHSSKFALITKRNCAFEVQANTLLEFNILTITL